MTTHMADDTLVDTSLPTSPPLPTPEPINHSSALGAPSVQSAHHPVVVPRTQLDDAAQTDVEMPSIQVPDEAALAAAAAAMAAAAQRHVDGLPQQQVTPDGIDTTDDLNSYLLAAAAASVHAQQQHNGDDHHAAQSEDSFDSTATPAPNSIYTNGTSVNGSDADDARAAIHDQCRKYTDHRAPYPLTIGKRTPGGCAEFLAHRDDSQSHAQHLEHLPFTDATVGLGKTRCYWALLSADHSKANRPTGEKLHFVYLDPVLQQHMAEQAGQMVGSDFYDYVHPEERHRVSDDMQKIVESRTLFGSVTRCRYSRLPRIRELLGAINPPRDPEADRYVEDDSFVAIDIVINWIGDGMLLCFFHAIIDKAQEDNDEQHKSEWTNWCGTPGPSFTLRQCDTLWKQVKAVPREVVPDSGPVHVFQVIEAGGDGRVLLSWPPPRLFSRDVAAHLITQSDTTVFQDGSYFADDFARLAQGVSIAPGSSSLSDANTSCTRRFRAKHTLTTEGKVRSIESVLIPYGGVILACFHTTFQQQLPPPDPKPLLHARSTLPAQPERRKAEHDVSQSSPNKRSRTEASAEQSDVAASTVSNAVDSQSTSTATQAKNAPPASSLPPATPVKNEPCAARSATRPPPPKAQTAKADYAPTSKTPVSKYIKPSAKTESSGIAALANPSLMYTNAPTKPPATPTSVARPAAERNLSTPAQNGTNGHASHAAPSPGGDSPNASQNKACTGCGKINSPEWRRGPSGHKTLCNACGLRYARSLTRRKKKKGKDGEVEFIEPTGDPSVVPKSRGGGGGSLPGVHRKNSKKRKEEEAAKAAAAATVAAVAVGPGALLPAVTSTPTGALNGTPASSSATTSSSVSATQSPPATTPAAKSASPSLVDSAKTTAAGVGAAQATVKVEQVDGSQAGASDSAAAPAPVSEPLASNTEAATATLAGDCAHSMAVSIALNAIAQATSSVTSIVAEALPLPVSNAISRAIAATIGSTDGGAGGLLTSQALSSTSNADSVLPSVPSVTIETTDDTAALDSTVSAAALQTIESVVSEALYKQLVHSSLPDAPAAVAFSNDKSNAVAVPSVADLPMVADASVAEPAIDLSHALTADAIRAAAQAAVAHGVGAEESIDSQAQT